MNGVYSAKGFGAVNDSGEHEKLKIFLDICWDDIIEAIVPVQDCRFEIDNSRAFGNPVFDSATYTFYFNSEKDKKKAAERWQIKVQ